MPSTRFIENEQLYRLLISLVNPSVLVWLPLLYLFKLEIAAEKKKMTDGIYEFQENVTRKLMTIPKEDFADCFEK